MVVPSLNCPALTSFEVSARKYSMETPMNLTSSVLEPLDVGFLLLMTSPCEAIESYIQFPFVPEYLGLIRPCKSIVKDFIEGVGRKAMVATNNLLILGKKR